MNEQFNGKLNSSETGKKLELWNAQFAFKSKQVLLRSTNSLVSNGKCANLQTDFKVLAGTNSRRN